jgi:hypothetical protein
MPSSWKLKSIYTPRASVASYALRFPSSPILVTLMMEALLSSEISVLTRATRRNISKEGIIHSHRRENLKYYNTEEVLRLIILIHFRRISLLLLKSNCGL